MTTPRRPRRQGVVYGPPLRGSSDGASLVGRLIGALIVIGAVVVLLVGALAVIGGGPNAGLGTSPTPTLPGSSPSPSASARPPSSPRPTPTAAPTVSPTASPFAIEVEEGPGKITFARDYTAGFELIERRVEFTLSDQIAWQANIGDPVGRVRVNFDISRVDPTTMEETNVHSGSFVGRNANARLYFAKAPVNREVDGPGVYVMRYSVDGETISEGYFRVTE